MPARLATLAAVLAALAVVPSAARASGFVVDSTADTVAAGAPNGACDAPGPVCTLREALREAGSLSAPRTIGFANALDGLEIQPASDLNVPVTGLTIDGCANVTIPVPPCITLRRAGSKAGTGLGVTAAGTTIRNLALVNFTTAIDLSGAGAGATLTGNFIGLKRDGTHAATDSNDFGIRVGDADDVAIGGLGVGEGNVISGNNSGIDQFEGTGSIAIQRNVLGLDPDASESIPNGVVDATVGGSAAKPAAVTQNSFGPAPTGLRIAGAGATVTGNVFAQPSPVPTYDAAAILVEPGADDVTIGGPAFASFPVGCFPLLGSCNVVAGVASGAPGIWIRGADRTTISGNLLGGPPWGPPLAGPPVHITDGPGASSSGTIVGGDTPTTVNQLVRVAGPAVEVSGSAAGVVVRGNIGIATSELGAVFTDLLPGAGLGNSGPVNGGIQPPQVTQATTTGIAGLATPGATIRVAQQQRAPVVEDPEPGAPAEGFFFPAEPSLATARADGVWAVTFTTALREGQKLTASQTTASGSSEYASLAAATQGGTLPVVTITSGPPAATAQTSATFTFVSDVPGSTFECSIDGGAYAACASPLAVGPLESGGHQLRVRAIDPLGAVGGPASRAWLIDPAAAGAGPAGGASQRPAVSFKAVVSLPSSRRCASRRRFRIRLRTPSGARLASAVVRVNGRRVRTVRGKALSAPVDLRGLPKGRVRVQVRVTLADGRVITGSRRYRTCTPRKSGKRRR